MSNPLDELDELLEKWYHKFDLQAVRIMLGAAKFHYLDLGDPVWLLLEGASGKTTMLKLLTGLDQAQKLGIFDEKAFLNEKDGDGFLERFASIEEEGNVYTIRGNTLFVYDNIEYPLPKPAIVRLLQQLHAGEFRRIFKNKEKIWKGKVTIIGASRPNLYNPLPDALREEFLQVKLGTDRGQGVALKAIEQIPHGNQIDAALRSVVRKLFDASPSSPAPTLSKEQEKRLWDLFPDAAPQLVAIAKGIAALQRRDKVEEQDLKDALRVGKDTKGMKNE